MTTIVTISGMRTVHCVRAVFTALGAVEGIVRANVTMGRAVIEHDGHATAQRLRDAVCTAGYDVTETRDLQRVLPVA